MEKINIKVITIKTEHTAFGNNISMNDKVAIVSDAYSKKSFETLKEALHGLKVEQHSLAKTTVPGSIGKITNIGAIFSTNLSETEINSVEKLLGFEIGIGTVNLGNPFVASGIIANSFGFAIGSMSSGFEMGRVDESLRLLK
jgi:translation initiation factor 6